MSYPHPQDLHDPRQYPPTPRHAAGHNWSPGPYAGPAAPGGDQPIPAGYPVGQTPSHATPAVPPAVPAAGPPHTVAQYAVVAPRPSRPSAWPRFGDDLFRLAHDGGRLFVDQDLIALGLACAMLAELGAGQHIDVDQQGRVVVVNRRPPPDALAHTVLDQLAAEPEPVHVYDCLRFLSKDAYQQVARRMVLSGDLREITRKRLFGGQRTSYAPTDNNTAYWACARLNTSMSKGRDFDPFDRVLVGLLLSTGVYRRVFENTSGSAVTQLTAYSRQTRQPIPALLGHLDSFVGNTASTVTAR
ncbi:GPP34 family phosphoprotein [Actinoplanes sp. L3-i22]|uniref:GOLPH3/VPS74 family protein n=1 Tax=Actinoplanes sp. L3-i22 TaxID=2836373 RepID=UPI001C761D68|nr:GPP34 family phosphoprotein [Actinoplanes sp. L3-i22]BCY11077.1 hypothetical protein L3i22_061650 [Actinoplanes sp. L3-i22]